MRHPIPTLAALAALSASLAACGAEPAAGAIPRASFVKANIDLRLVPDTAARGDSLRKAALRRHRVSEADLRRFVEVHGGSPEYLAAVWREVADSVQKRYDRTAPADPRPPEAGIPAAAPQPAGIPGAPVPPNQPPVVQPGEGNRPPFVRPREVRKPPRAPNPPPPPVTEPPRPMVRAPEAAPTRRPPAGPPPDARGPTTVPIRPPVVVPPDTPARRPR